MTAAPPATVSSATPNLRSTAVFGLVWSVVENWGSRVIALLTSLVLARLLSPELFGIAAAAALILGLVPLVAELGLTDALIQRKRLSDADVTLPFATAFTLALAVTGVVVWHADILVVRLGIPHYPDFLVAIACTVPFGIPLLFQDAMYRRAGYFRLLAVRALVANMIAGAIGIALAYRGFGLWTFVAQAYCGMAITTAWLTWRAKWKPTTAIAPESMLPLLRFGLPTVAQRLIDFASTKVVDLIIVTQIGLTAYGLYAVGSRLYQTLLQLLQGAFSKVAFTLLSQIASERERIVNAYEETVSLAASIISPIFVMLALVAPELIEVLFDARWTGIAAIMQPLLLLGAVQAVQYMNGSFLSASGRPGRSLITGTVRCLLILTALLLFGGRRAEDITWVFVLASLAASPLSFFVVIRTIAADPKRIARLIVAPWLTALFAFVAVFALRPPVFDAITLPSLRGIAIGSTFLALYAGFLSLVSPSGARRALRLAGELLAPIQRRLPASSL